VDAAAEAERRVIGAGDVEAIGVGVALRIANTIASLGMILPPNSVSSRTTRTVKVIGPS